MKLNGWQRIWVLIAVVYGGAVIFYAFQNQPSESNVRWLWLYEASNLMSDKVEEHEGRDIPGYRFREKITEDKSYEEATDWLLKAATSPSVNQKIFSDALALVNEKYQKQLEYLPETKTKYFLMAAGFWLVPLLILYALGWSIGWITRGFKQANH